MSDFVLTSLQHMQRLVYTLIIGIQEGISLFTQRLLATACAYRQKDLKGKLVFQCVIISVTLERLKHNYFSVGLRQ